jgi:large subunit ribosomal protein L10
MNRDQKAAVVHELSEQIRAAETIFAVDYRGISVSDAADLRGRLRDAGTSFRVVKNSLTERASDQAGASELKAMLEGPTALAFVTGDAALAAKALNDAARAFGTLQFKGGLMNGDTLTAEQIQSIARLPSRDVLTGQLVGTIAAPLSQLVRTLNALISGIAVQLQGIADQGLGGANAASASDAATPEGDADEGSESTRATSDADAAPGEAGGEAAAADAPPGDEAGEEASAAEAPVETAEEPAPEADAAEAPAETAEEPASEQPAAEAAQEPENEASDAEASEE